MSVFAAIIFLIWAVGTISVFVFLARVVRKKSENEGKYKLVYEMMMIFLVFVILLISLIFVPIQAVKSAIIVLLCTTILAVPIYLVFGLQRYLFTKYKKTWHLILLTITQFICFAVSGYWLFHKFEQGVEEGAIDGPVGLSVIMFISTLTFAMIIIWIINCFTAWIVYFKQRPREDQGVRVVEIQ